MKALLVIDMINDFVHPKGKLYCKTARKVIPQIVDLVTKARKENTTIIYITDYHKEGDIELQLWGAHAMASSWGSKCIKSLEPKNPPYGMRKEFLVKKRFYSGFTRTDLNQILRTLGIKTLIITGMHTHICVAHTCYDAYIRKYKLIVISDATGTVDNKKHKESLEFIRTAYGAKIIKSEDLE